MDYKIVLGILATIIGFTGYILYFRDIFRGRTKPHIFSWLVWGILGAIAFAAQIVKGGGAGAWVNGVAAFTCFAVAALAYSRGEKKIVVTDWICFWSAIVAIALWQITNDPLISVVIVTLADLLAFAPTFRKAFINPWEETVGQYSTSAIKYFLSIPALGSLSATTALYPAVLVVANVAFVAMTLVRRKISLRKQRSE